MSLANMRGKLLVSFGLGLAIVLAFALYADLPRFLEAIANFQWRFLPLILGLTLLNYVLRYVKWHFYLHQIGVHIGKLDSFLLFFSGLSMVMTPGKVGEWLKSYLLKELSGTPMTRSAPIIIAERLSDGLAMLLLASGGMMVFKTGWEISVLVLTLAIVLIAVIQYRPLASRLLNFGERLPLLSSKIHLLHELYESSFTLFSFKNLMIAVGLGFVSWLGECIAFYFVLVGLGQEGTWLLILQASFILAISTLAGSVFLMPGGLGIAEGGITGLCQMLLSMAKESAVAATLLIRFCTLWFGVTLGMISLIVVTRKLAKLGISGRDMLETTQSTEDRLLTKR